MAKSQEKTGVFKRFSDFLTPSSSEPPSQPGSPSRPDRPEKDRKKFRNRISFNKSLTTLPSRSTSPLYPTSLTENPDAETTSGKHSHLLNTDPMANPTLDRSLAISQYGTPQIIAWRLRYLLEYSDNYAPQTSDSPPPTSSRAVQSEQPHECVYEGDGSQLIDAHRPARFRNSSRPNFYHLSLSVWR